MFSRMLVVLLLSLSMISASFAEELKRVVVLEFRGVGTDQEILLKFSDQVRSAAVSQLNPEEFVLMTRENTRELLSDMGKDITCMDGECEIEIGRNLQADYIITGHLLKIEEMYVLTLKLYDTHKGTLIATSDVNDASLFRLKNKTLPASKELIREGLNAHNRLLSLSKLKMQDATEDESQTAEPSVDKNPVNTTPVEAPADDTETVPIYLNARKWYDDLSHPDRTPINDSHHNIEISMSGGVAKFQSMNFIAYGGTLGIPMNLNVRVMMEGYVHWTSQVYPPLDENGDPTEAFYQVWRALIPIHVGVEYVFSPRFLGSSNAKVSPFIGPKLVILPAYAGAGSGSAVGLLTSGGMDMVLPLGVALKLRGDVGFWNGQYFQQVPSPNGGMLKSTALYTGVSLSPTLRF